MKKVLVVDDSALAIEIISELINSIEGYMVSDTARNCEEAARKIMDSTPDIVTLDIEMPEMNGLQLLEKLMTYRPVSVLMISGLLHENAELVLKAFDLGAVEVFAKPNRNIAEKFSIYRDELKQKLDICSESKLVKKIPGKMAKEKKSDVLVTKKKYDADVILPTPIPQTDLVFNEKVIVIGASTGGTVAIGNLLASLPSDMPGIVIVQHMPSGFSRTFAERLDKRSNLKVKEAEAGDVLKPGMVLIAPGGKHILVKRDSEKTYVELSEGPAVCRHRPSADVLFRSAAHYLSTDAVGVILTGMGDDGAKCLKEMKEAGAETVGQNMESCTIFGMPRVAHEIGAVDKLMSLEDISKYLLKFRKK